MYPAGNKFLFTPSSLLDVVNYTQHYRTSAATWLWTDEGLSYEWVPGGGHLAGERTTTTGWDSVTLAVGWTL